MDTNKTVFIFVILIILTKTIMSKFLLTEAEQEELRKNPHIKGCTSRSVAFTPAFKKHAVKEFNARGKNARTIFLEAGIPLHSFRRDYPKESLKQWRDVIKKFGEEHLDGEHRGSGGIANLMRFHGKNAAYALMNDKQKVAYLEAENEILRYIKKKFPTPPVDCILTLSTGERLDIAHLVRKSAVALRCAILGISRSGYYAAPTRLAARTEREAACVLHLRTIAAKKRHKIGIRGLKMAYDRATGTPINTKKVWRIKRVYNIPTLIRKKRARKEFFKKDGAHRTVPNVVNRQFDVGVPYKRAGTDVTYCFSDVLSRYFSVSNIRDFATGEYLGWSVSLHNDLPLVYQSLLKMEGRLSPVMYAGMLLHSDQGGQYTSPEYQAYVERIGILPSMSRKGNCIDNAPTESGHGHMKDEFDLRNCASVEEARQLLDTQMCYHNDERPQWGREKMTQIGRAHV